MVWITNRIRVRVLGVRTKVADPFGLGLPRAHCWCCGCVSWFVLCVLTLVSGVGVNSLLVFLLSAWRAPPFFVFGAMAGSAFPFVVWFCDVLGLATLWLLLVFSVGVASGGGRLCVAGSVGPSSQSLHLGPPPCSLPDLVR